jgi:hypothetical protein
MCTLATMNVPTSADRLLVILSDIEMGAGGPTDDFPHSDVLGDLLLRYNEGPTRELPIDFIFNGDTFDLLKTPYNGAFPRHITRDAALGKMQAVSAAHPLFFEAVKALLEHPHAERRAHFIFGNHDAELAFPELQSLVRTQCGNDPRISFPGLSLDIGRVHIQHGSQSDPMFRVDPKALFVDYEGERILNISWGAAALLDTVIPLKDLLCFHDRLKPKELLFKLVPEIRDLLTARFWSYWGRDFWKGYFKGPDPTQQLNWTMLKEVVWRFASKNPDVMPLDELTSRLSSSDEFLLYVLGHKHQPAWTSYGDRKVLQAGCLRNEYMLLADGAIRPIQKSYVEAYLRDGVPVISHLIEVESPPAPEGYVPTSIFDVVPAVRALLATSPVVPDHPVLQEPDKRLP